tara:strand:- start:805 stop:1509 length:705 start_codon:yes stop_codon:yes gene_type:complete
MKRINKNMKSSISNNLYLKLLALLLFTFYPNNEIKSQILELPEIVSGEVLESIKGSTVNTSSSSGSTSSLSFGSSTRFGTSASINGTSATKSSSESTFKVGSSSSTQCSSGGCINSNIGGTDGKFSAKVLNIKANNLETFQETSINSTNNNFTNAEADITGIGADNSITLDGDATIFKARAATVHSDSDYDSISSSVLSDDTQTASGSSSGFTSTNTNVDINVSDYVNTFQQAF